MESKRIRLSFIVPFYGVEEFIGQCLTSLTEQDIDEDEYEVICVNDCSPDKSEQIVLSFLEKHKNIVLICHEKNKKLGAARNTGLKAARGKYVWFIDSDDYIQENCLSHVLDLCEQNDVEILHFNIQDNYGRLIRRLVPTDVITGPEEELISEKQRSIEITYPWNRIYKREFLLNNELWFNNTYGGDVIHTILAINACERMKNVDELFYFYRVDNLKSDTKSLLTAEKVYSMCFIVPQEIEQIIPSIKSQWKSQIVESVRWRINSSFKCILKLPNTEKKSLMQLLNCYPSVYSFIMQKGSYKLRLILNIPFLLRTSSILYNGLRKTKMKNVCMLFMRK